MLAATLFLTKLPNRLFTSSINWCWSEIRPEAWARLSKIPKLIRQMPTSAKWETLSLCFHFLFSPREIWKQSQLLIRSSNRRSCSSGILPSAGLTFPRRRRQNRWMLIIWNILSVAKTYFNETKPFFIFRTFRGWAILPVVGSAAQFFIYPPLRVGVLQLHSSTIPQWLVELQTGQITKRLLANCPLSRNATPLVS